MLELRKCEKRRTIPKEPNAAIDEKRELFNN